MLNLRFLSIKERMLLIILTVSFISVTLTAVTISYMSIMNQEEKMIQDIKLTTSIIGDRSRFDIKFNRRGNVSQNLQILKMRPSITKACIYDAKGLVFAKYPLQDIINNKTASVTCPPITTKYTELNDSKLEIAEYIDLDGKHIGAIYIEKDLHKTKEITRKYKISVFIVFITIMMFAYLMAMRFQASISSPVQRLTKAAKEIADKQDYGVRAELLPKEKNNNEQDLSQLLNTFNQMLEQVEEHDRQLQKNNLELGKAKEIAEVANLTKTRFLASISHELRTPLNAIIGFSSIITGQLFGPINPKYLEYAEDIHDSGSHLLEVINDILDLSKAESGKLKLDMEEFNAERAVRRCINILSERAELGQITINLSNSHNLPYIIADRVRFIQIILNILSNAVKFTHPNGKVDIAISSREIREHCHEFTFHIHDTGIGMNKDEVAQALKSFRQVDCGLNRKHEGTGLGLPLSRKLIELHHGDIEIDSEPDKGTAVVLRFPSDPSNLKKITM